MSSKLAINGLAVGVNVVDVLFSYNLAGNTGSWVGVVGSAVNLLVTEALGLALSARGSNAGRNWITSSTF